MSLFKSLLIPSSLVNECLHQSILPNVIKKLRKNVNNVLVFGSFKELFPICKTGRRTT